MLSCDPENVIDNSTDTTDNTDDNSNDNTDDTTSASEESTDYVWDTSDITYITLNTSSISVDGSGASVSGTTVTITENGNYQITGTLSNGIIKVDNDNDGVVRLLLNGVTVNSNTTSPLWITNAKKVVLVLNDGKTNTFTDSSSYTDISDGQNGTIYSKSYLSVYGNGTLNIEANYEDGIHANDGLVIKSGNISIDSKDEAVIGKDYLLIHDASMEITSGGDALKSDNEEDTLLGYVTIEDGDFDITSTYDAVSAQTDLTISGGNFDLVTGGGSSYVSTDSARGFKGLESVTIANADITVNAADDGIKSDGDIAVTDSDISISSSDDGIQSDTNISVNANVTVSKSDEGFTAKYITINGGYISITSSDDAINSTSGSATEQSDGSHTYIYGGTLVLNTSSGDGLDSNGNITMTAGTVIIHGPQSQPEVPIDYNGMFNISGGFLIASGPASTNMLQAPSTSSSQKSLKITFSSSNASSTLFHIEDAGGNSLVTFKPVRSYYSIIFSSSSLATSTTYNLYTGGSCTGTNTDGLYSGGTYSGGTLRKTFTVSGTVTSISVN